MNELGLIPLPPFYKENLAHMFEWWLNNGEKVGSPVTWNTIITNIFESSGIKNYEIEKKVKEFVE